MSFRERGRHVEQSEEREFERRERTLESERERDENTRVIK